MQLKTENAKIEAGEIIKVGLRFNQSEDPNLTKQYVLFVKKNGQPYENILLSIIYDEF